MQLGGRIVPDVRNLFRKQRIIQESSDAVQNAWNAVHQMEFRRLVVSMRRRCTADVHTAKGGGVIQGITGKSKLFIYVFIIFFINNVIDL